MMLYLVGSLRNPRIPHIAKLLRDELNVEVFDEWWAPGKTTDEEWQAYETARGRSYLQAIGGYHAKHVFEFDKHHLDRAAAAVLAYPAGKSAHLELGYMVGRGKPGYIILDGEPERWDVMTQFATGIFDSVARFTQWYKEEKR